MKNSTAFFLLMMFEGYFFPEIEHLVVMKDIGTSDIIVTTPEARF